MKGQPLSWPPSRPLARGKTNPPTSAVIQCSLGGVGREGAYPPLTALWVQNEKREVAHLALFIFCATALSLLAILYQRNSAKKRKCPPLTFNRTFTPPFLHIYLPGKQIIVFGNVCTVYVLVLLNLQFDILRFYVSTHLPFG